MIVEMAVPAAGESVTEATIGAILVLSGSYVKEDQAILELETDKANMPLNAVKSGKLEILVKEGDDVKVGQIIVKIDTSAKAPHSTTAPEKKAEVPVASKATVAKPVVETPPHKEVSKSKSAVTEKYTKSSTKTTVEASPAASKLSAENNLNLAQVVGTGKGGRITKEDVINQIKNPAPVTASFLGSFPPPPSLGYVSSSPEPIVGERETRKKMTRLRRVIAKKLLSAKNETAMLTTFNEVNMGRIMKMRATYKDKFKEVHDVNLGYMSFFIRACTEALKAYPAVNAYLENEDVVYLNYYDISVAVGTPKGLVVPVVRNCDKLSFADIEKTINKFAIKGRAGELEISDMEGGGFTISNGGVYGSLLSTPILNAPQSAILGMHKIQERPIVENGLVVVAPMMYLALSYDHRIIDGKEAVSFLVKVKDLIEDPAGLLFNL
jgi:2-oxoglutarate dehydrogenase E2 component (dihydrolipoamide succinyltransferase)